jgi:hypothetical protein
LAIIGIGWQTFISAVFKGAKKLGITPITPTIKNMTEKTKQYIANVTKGSWACVKYSCSHSNVSIYNLNRWLHLWLHSAPFRLLSSKEEIIKEVVYTQERATWLSHVIKKDKHTPYIWTIEVLFSTIGLSNVRLNHNLFKNG